AHASTAENAVINRTMFILPLVFVRPFANRFLLPFTRRI
ncbi:MAG: hypothetical protein QOD09_5136, partial [Bradyrhizobium sp.]|nr:hypothetical protein [Bradyrhizobium sp.]